MLTHIFNPKTNIRWCSGCKTEHPLTHFAGQSDRCRSYHAKYYQEHKTAHNAKREEWRKGHPDKLKAQQRRAKLLHGRRYRLEYRGRHPDVYRVRARHHDKNRRLRRIVGVYKRDGGICGICGKRVKRAEVSIDHIVPVSCNGDNKLTNLQLAHLRCNIKRGAGRVAAQMRLV